MRLLLSYSEVSELLLQGGELRPREVRRLLQRGLPQPVAHGLHSRRRWARQTVLDYIAALKQNGGTLGEGCAGRGSL